MRLVVCSAFESEARTELIRAAAIKLLELADGFGFIRLDLEFEHANWLAVDMSCPTAELLLLHGCVSCTDTWS